MGGDSRLTSQNVKCVLFGGNFSDVVVIEVLTITFQTVIRKLLSFNRTDFDLRPSTYGTRDFCRLQEIKSNRHQTEPQ